MLYLLSYGHQAHAGFYQERFASKRQPLAPLRIHSGDLSPRCTVVHGNETEVWSRGGPH